MNRMFETEQLQEKLRLIKQAKAENELYRIKGLFNGGIVVPVIVEAFQRIYDTTFEFEREPKGLYEAIAQWIGENIG